MVGVGGGGISLNGGAGIKLFGPASTTFDGSQGFVLGQLSGPMIIWNSTSGQPGGVLQRPRCQSRTALGMTDTPPDGGQPHAIGATCLWRKRRGRTSFGG
jgi:hypothetical protein